MGRYEIGPLAPSMPHEAVMIARGRAASIRCARDCAANPPKTAAWMAPSRVIASAAISAVGIIGTAECGQTLNMIRSSGVEKQLVHTVDDHHIALPDSFFPQHTRENLHLIQ